MGTVLKTQSEIHLAPTGAKHGAPPQDRLLVVDVETVPDAENLPAGFDPASFPKPGFHRVVAISYLTATITRYGDGTEGYEIGRCCSGGQPDWAEGRLLRGFWEMFEAGRYRLVTWNGRKFDIPVLRTRALAHGIQTKAWYSRGDRWQGYGSRWGTGHIDVMDRISDQGAAASLGLDETCKLLGLPGKIGGDGGSVAAMVAGGQMERVRAYCECDVVATYCAYLRHAHHTGLCSDETHDFSVASLISYLGRERGSRPHLGASLDSWKRPFLGPMLARKQDLIHLSST